MVNPEVVFHPSMAKITIMHANVIAMLDLTGHMIIWVDYSHMETGPLV
jgi:hypothetical protein